jgi:RNA polymerase sigma-70 factor (ECF subfamily)
MGQMPNIAWVETDADIYRPLKERDAEGLARLYDRYAGLAYGLALKVVTDSGRAEDIVQEVFLSVWNKPASFDPDRGSFRTWLLTLVRNRSIDALRGRSRREMGEVELPVQLVDNNPDSDPWPALALSMERDLIREAVRSLPAEQSQAIELAFFGGYTHSEIATRLDLPLGTVKGRLRLGMEKLHSYLTARGLMSS